MKRSPAFPIAAAILAASLAAHMDASAQTPPPPTPPVAVQPPPAPLSPPATPANAAAWTRVRIVTQTPGVVLERRVGSLSTDPRPANVYESEPRWDRVCAAPCDVAAPLGAEFRIGGEGVTTSSSFPLHGPSTELHVDGGSATARRVGSWFAIIGFVAAAAGGAFLGVAALKPADPKNPSTGLGAGEIASIVTLVTGGVFGFTGVGLIAGNGTTVRDESRRELARLGPPSMLHATFSF